MQNRAGPIVAALLRGAAMSVENSVQLPRADECTHPRDIRKTGISPDFWYPLARSNSVKAGKAHAVSFAGEPIVLVRTRQGEVFAVEDRCAHRQIPLHLGVVEDDCIKCAYHGW